MTTMPAPQVPPSAVPSDGVEIAGRLTTGYLEILTPGAVRFLAGLARRFEGRRTELLRSRALKQDELNHGWLPDFPQETKWIRDGDWKVSSVPAELCDRRVEIAGPVDRSTMVAALNSGACLFMADMEDGTSPTWENLMDGQLNLRDAVDYTLTAMEDDGTPVELAEKPATLAVRPRAWHLEEKHLLVDGRPIAATLFDVGLFLYHNAQSLIENGSAPYVYLPKLETYFEARLWNDLFVYIQDDLRIPRGTIKATILIETLLAAFQMDEIIFELREHTAGVRHGRWDYAFNTIKRFRNRSEFVFPDRTQMPSPSFLDTCVDLIIKTSHRRGIHAIASKSAETPIAGDQETKSQLFATALHSFQRNVAAGHDGASVADPSLVPLATGYFDAALREPNQIDRLRADVSVTPEDLLAMPAGEVSEQGLRTNVRVVLRYLAAWLTGHGRIVFEGRTENAATAELARTQVWQWAHHQVELTSGGRVSRDRVLRIIDEELAALEQDIGQIGIVSGQYDTAAGIAREVMTADTLPEFLTAWAYPYLD